MADREDSIHIRIKIDIDDEDRLLQENLATNLAKADEQQAVRKATGVEGDIADTEIQREIEELEDEIKEIQRRIEKGIDPQDPEVIKAKLEAKKQRLEFRELKQGPVGVIDNLTQEQAGNLRKAATNPSGFIVLGIGKILGRYGAAAVRGGIIAGIGLLIYETTLFFLDQLMQPGRLLDRRFKRIARLETMLFYERTLQEEIRHGYQEIRVATMVGLRGGQSQVNGNLFEFSSGAVGIIQSSPYRSSQDVYRSQMADGKITDKRGNPRRRSVFFSGR